MKRHIAIGLVCLVVAVLALPAFVHAANVKVVERGVYRCAADPKWDVVVTKQFGEPNASGITDAVTSYLVEHPGCTVRYTATLRLEPAK